MMIEMVTHFRSSIAPASLDDYIWVRSKLQSHDLGGISKTTADVLVEVALNGDKPTGGVVYCERLGWIHIESLWVEPFARRIGIGSALLEKAESFARARQLLGVRLTTTSKHLALGIYQKRGYRIDARYPCRIGENDSMIEMLLSLLL